MEPLKPEQKRSVLGNNSQAQPSDIEEYERLLSLRYTEDPDQQPATFPEKDAGSVHAQREARIKELYQKLFAPATTPAGPSRR
ncbi:MAG: hypothetical protein LAP21_26905 [Acidobacteriia bacterium]|nr:hypothetical protein [Terriglobia bacterium]